MADLRFLLCVLFLFAISTADRASAARFPGRISQPPPSTNQETLRTAVFALGSFWRSEAAFGCLPGVVRTSVGYAGGSKTNPEYRNLGDHAECVRIEYNPKLIQFKQLLDVFWASHDSRQVFGQGPDVGNQYRSIIFTNGTQESRLAALSKEREQAKSRSSVVTTEIQELGVFYPAEAEHQVLSKCLLDDTMPTKFFPLMQKFELKRKWFLLQLIGNLSNDELLTSNLACKLNGYAAELCPSNIQSKISAKIDEIVKTHWPLLRDI